MGIPAHDPATAHGNVDTDHDGEGRHVPRSRDRSHARTVRQCRQASPRLPFGDERNRYSNLARSRPLAPARSHFMVSTVVDRHYPDVEDDRRCIRLRARFLWPSTSAVRSRRVSLCGLSRNGSADNPRIRSNSSVTRRVAPGAAVAAAVQRPSIYCASSALTSLTLMRSALTSLRLTASRARRTGLQRPVAP